MTLTNALDIFQDHLLEIKQACIENIEYSIISINEYYDTRPSDWLHDELRQLEIKQTIATPGQVIKRINGRLAPRKAGQITDEDIQRAKEVPIEELFDGQLFRSNRNLVGRCPFHAEGRERTPSFTINVEKNIWKCYGCGEFGDPADFIQKRDGVGFIQAIRRLI